MELTLIPCVLSRRAAGGSHLTEPKSLDSPRQTRDLAMPQQHLSSNPAHFTITSSSNPAHHELVAVSSSSPIMVQRSCSSELTPSHSRDAPVTPRSREESGDAHHVQVASASCRRTAERDEVRGGALLIPTHGPDLHPYVTFLSPFLFLNLAFVCWFSFFPLVFFSFLIASLYDGGSGWLEPVVSFCTVSVSD